jgi:hypothetical protein
MEPKRSNLNKGYNIQTNENSLILYLGCNVLFEGKKLMLTITGTSNNTVIPHLIQKNIKIEITQIIGSSRPPLCQ